MISGYFQQGILSKALAQGLLEINITDLKLYAQNRYNKVDRKVYGKGRGMLYQAPVLEQALQALQRPQARVIVLSPTGRILDNKLARELARTPELTLITARYEGIDHRFIEQYADLEVSIGEYVLTGGELPALVLCDAVARFVPGSVKTESAEDESFEQGLLEYPHYTEPRVWNERVVPQVLFSGDHRQVDSFRFYQSLKRTYENRIDLLWKYPLPRYQGSSRDKWKRLTKENIMRKEFLSLIEKMAKEWKDGRRN